MYVNYTSTKLILKEKSNVGLCWNSFAGVMRAIKTFKSHFYTSLSNSFGNSLSFSSPFTLLSLHNPLWSSFPPLTTASFPFFMK